MLSTFSNGETNNDGYNNNTNNNNNNNNKSKNDIKVNFANNGTSSPPTRLLNARQLNSDQGGKKRTKKKGRFKNKSQLFSKHNSNNSAQGKASQLKATTSLHNLSSNLSGKQDQKLPLNQDSAQRERSTEGQTTENIKSTMTQTGFKEQTSKQAAPITTPVLPSHLHFQGIPETPISTQAYRSPRKEALTRQKQNDHTRDDNRIDLREHLKPKGDSTTTSTGTTTHEDTSPSVTLMMEDKVTLFKYKSLDIIELPHKDDKTGSLLAHGEFEIFQLLNGGVTCLSCGGKLFIYPLLPKIKIFRISFNQFLIPMLNPERYWKITIDTEESNVLAILQGTLERNVNYIHVSDKMTSSQPASTESSDQILVAFESL